MNKLLTTNFEIQKKEFELYITKSKDIYERVENLKVLPKTNKAINDSLVIIKNLNELTDKNKNKLFDSIEIVLTDAKKVFFFTNTFIYDTIIK